MGQVLSHESGMTLPYHLTYPEAIKRWHTVHSPLVIFLQKGMVTPILLWGLIIYRILNCNVSIDILFMMDGPSVAKMLGNLTMTKKIKK